MFFASLGAYSVSFQPFDLAILLVIGLLGLAMRRFGIPVLPLIIGVILGPELEEQPTTSLQISSGDISTLWSEPVAVIVYVIIAAALVWIVGSGLRKKRTAAANDKTEVAA
ncbi:tripartite tricarboxylate transporter permease [Aeromicrobium sp. UC242_57]|uniref:tripartite tricarboxylate transporter permease n=1 Tax=Aeromicrobium sp. UC242_57 TaxID=3374624 RepID=UPI0037B629E6